MKPYDLILENMTILTMDSAGTIIEGGIIGIENGIISLIEKKKPDNDYPANKRIDAKGMIALPGFVNPSTRTCIVFLCSDNSLILIGLLKMLVTNRSKTTIQYQLYIN